MTESLKSSLEYLGFYWIKNYCHSESEYSNYDFLRIALKNKICSTNMEIPLLYREIAEEIILNDHNANLTDILYLFKENKMQTKGVSDLLSIVFTSKCNARLIELKLRFKNKDDVYYYGQRGILLDSEYNPLLLITVKESYIEDTDEIDSKCFNLYINPIIYKENNSINKTIIKDIIPYCINNKIALYKKYSLSNQKIPVNIIISDQINDFFVRPDEPSVGNINKEINNLLLNNIDAIINN